ncbi:hypothetical protein [Burkholderia seminalis]|uniref:hypothetical protein n=1 Tax=Burkholderia seminalis TaxID=488731 RepID=UPI001904CD1D|nr:hypothetical protein [Burkholderia seminalis]MBJ9593212.1 hypothetical protein [Burkholderia seminalis]
MKRITKDMIRAGGHRFCCECSARGPRVKAHWTHKGRDYCDAHKPAEPVERHTREVTA